MGKILEAATILLSIGLILFIVNSALSTSNYKKRAFINFLICLILTIVFGVSYYLDFYVFKKTYELYIYLFFIGSSFLYLIFVPLIMYKKAGRYTHAFRKKEFIKQEEKIKDFVYIIYKYNDYIYLNNNSGIIRKIRANDYEKKIIEEINNVNKLTINNVNIKKYGVMTICTNHKKNKHDRYSCYLIEINKSLNNKKYEKVYKNDLVERNLNYIDQQIIYRLMIGDDFRVYL